MRLPRVQLSLPAVFMVIAYVAIAMWFVRGICGFRRMVSTVVLEAVDGDVRALARNLVSTTVLDNALRTLKGGTLSSPKLASATDPREELRRMLIIEAESQSGIVRLSVVHQPHTWSEASRILIAVEASSEMVLGKNRVASRGHTFSDEHTTVEFTIVMILSSGLAYCLSRHHRSRQSRSADPSSFHGGLATQDGSSSRDG